MGKVAAIIQESVYVAVSDKLGIQANEILDTFVSWENTRAAASKSALGQTSPL